jgi:hypothetical protein
MLYVKHKLNPTPEPPGYVPSYLVRLILVVEVGLATIPKPTNESSRVAPEIVVAVFAAKGKPVMLRLPKPVPLFAIVTRIATKTKFPVLVYDPVIVDVVIAPLDAASVGVQVPSSYQFSN